MAGIPDGRTGYSTTFPYDMIYLCKKIGFRLRTALIWDKGVTLKKWNLDNMAVFQNHEYVWVMGK